MGYETKAEKNMDIARESIKKATEAISEIVIGKCEGYPEYRSEMAELRECLKNLIDLDQRMES